MDERKREILSRKTKEELFNMDRYFFTMEECKELIDNTRLTREDREICYLGFIECMTQQEIADRIKRDVRTVSTRLKKCSIGIRLTIVREFYKGSDMFDFIIQTLKDNDMYK